MNFQEGDLLSDSDAAAAAIAIRDGRGEPNHYILLGWYQVQHGDKRGGEALFREVLVEHRNHFGARLSLANILRDAGALKEAALHCDAVISADHRIFDAWYERGMVMLDGGVSSEARICFQQVLEIERDHASALAMLALIDARAGDADAARRNSEAALAREPSNVSARRALAMVSLEAGDHAGALAHLQTALEAVDHAGPERISILTLIGETHERAGASTLAEQAYVQANKDFLDHNAGLFAGRDPNSARIAALQRGFETARAAFPAAWSQPLAAHQPSPVFVLGHPRSGNTLLENVLATVPGASALEERPTLRAAERRYLSEVGMAELAQATDAEIEALRGAYCEASIQNGGDIAAPLFVDMDPLKSLRLPIIARLFPAARVLLVRRDPRDVVWSCYRTHFALTNAALDFATLEGAARHYAATMELVETVRAALPMVVHVVRYEDLVASFDETTQAIADFLSIPWQEEFRRFDKAAQLRGVTTASERQVRRGLFDGRRQWEAHAEFMEPVAEILAPWVDRFGYR